MTVEIQEVAPLVNPKLCEKITELLGKHGHPRPANWVNFVHPDALEVPDEGIQRFLINRYWRQEIGLLGGDTLDVRYCLVDQSETADWLRLFETGVVPCIIQNALPKSLH